MAYSRSANSYMDTKPDFYHEQDTHRPEISPAYSNSSFSSYPSGSRNSGSSSALHSQASFTSPESSFSTPLVPSQSYGSGYTHSRLISQGQHPDSSVEVREVLRPVRQTWNGWIHSSLDALKIIEACISGRLERVQRRPDENERPRIIASGSVFAFDETTTGILRWTDDKNWSPSRVRGNFMLYRELDSKVPPGEKKKALKKPKSPSSESGSRNGGERAKREDEGSIWGSHNDSYQYKEGGLMKKTFSTYYGDTKWSVIAYYDPLQAEKGMLNKVPEDQLLREVEPRPELLQRQGRREWSVNPLGPNAGQIQLQLSSSHPDSGHDHYHTGTHPSSGGYSASHFASSQAPYGIGIQPTAGDYPSAAAMSMHAPSGSYSSQYAGQAGYTYQAQPASTQLPPMLPHMYQVPQQDMQTSQYTTQQAAYAQQVSPRRASTQPQPAQYSSQYQQMPQHDASQYSQSTAVYAGQADPRAISMQSGGYSDWQTHQQKQYTAAPSGHYAMS